MNHPWIPLGVLIVDVVALILIGVLPAKRTTTRRSPR